MSLIKRMRKQTAIWWAKGAPDNYGQPTYSDPVEIRCRWEETAKEFIDSNHVRQISSVVVYVDRDVSPGDMLMLGSVDDLDTTTDPASHLGALEVKSFEKVGKISLREYLMVAYI